MLNIDIFSIDDIEHYYEKSIIGDCPYSEYSDTQ